MMPDKMHDRSYLSVVFGKKNVPEVDENTRLAEDLGLDECKVRLLCAYIKEKYGKKSFVRPEFVTIGDIDNYIFYEYYCGEHRYD